MMTTAEAWKIVESFEIRAGRDFHAFEGLTAAYRVESSRKEIDAALFSLIGAGEIEYPVNFWNASSPSKAAVDELLAQQEALADPRVDQLISHLRGDDLGDAARAVAEKKFLATPSLKAAQLALSTASDPHLWDAYRDLVTGYSDFDTLNKLRLIASFCGREDVFLGELVRRGPKAVNAFVSGLSPMMQRLIAQDIEQLDDL